jgi:hypothetical protein
MVQEAANNGNKSWIWRQSKISGQRSRPVLHWRKALLCDSLNQWRDSVVVSVGDIRLGRLDLANTVSLATHGSNDAMHWPALQMCTVQYGIWA